MTDLRIRVGKLEFQNPVLLAAGTAAFGRALDGVTDLDSLGGIVTKAVSLAPRKGNAAPRVAEFDGGMLNAIGLANPGVDEVKRVELPWLAAHVTRARVVVNVVAERANDFAEVVRQLEDSAENGAGVSAYELNVSCPNVKRGGTEFGADRATLTAVITGARAATAKLIFVKLSPTLGDIGDTARAAVDAGADGITVINTLPGLVIDVDTRRPRIGFGSGGVSGAGLLPIGVLATHKVRSAVDLPIIGVGGVASAADALQYIVAGASLVAVGTAALRNPRAPERIARDLGRWCDARNVGSIADLIGSLKWVT
ncbi:MAG: dihydroorotate dehydrogenase [Gemmatimonadaceae bacterium]